MQSRVESKLFAAVKTLPKNALAEVQAICHTGRVLICDPDDGDITIEHRSPVLSKGM